MQIDLSRYQHIVILTGAGVSAESGLRTYRGLGGVWDEHQVAEYGNARALAEAPAKTWQLFGGLRADIRQARPNAAHRALMQAEAALRSDQNFLIVTQNVDGLHQRAGSRRVVNLHGLLGRTRCSNPACKLLPFDDEQAHQDAVPLCPQCGAPLRPDVVLFDEELPALAMWETKRALRDCDLFLAIGTSGNVSPASNFVRGAEYAGARTVFINLEPLSPPNPAFQESYLGRAGELLPRLFGAAG